MSAEELRAAAALMRERAQAATPGPWWPHHTDGEPWAGDEALTIRLDAAPSYNEEDWDDWNATGTGSLFHGDVVHEPDAAHVASWHPTVALAVAAWLDACADSCAFDPPDSPGPTLALAVAGAYLGTQTPLPGRTQAAAAGPARPVPSRPVRAARGSDTATRQGTNHPTGAGL